MIDTPTAELADEAAPVPTPPRRWRRRLVSVLIMLTTLGLFLSVIGTWAHRTLLNTDTWVATMGPIVDDPRVIDALATELTDQVVAAVDIDELARQVLPDRASGLAVPITAAIEQYIRELARNLLATQQFKDLWVAANRRGHAAAVTVLRGGTGTVSTEKGVVTINLLPLLSRVLRAVDSKIPPFLGDRAIPEIDPATDPAEARAQLSSAIGRDLRPGFGEITLFRSDQLNVAQRAVTFFDRVVWFLWIVTAGLAAAALVLSGRRLRTLAALGIGAALAAALASAITTAVQNQVVDLVLVPERREAVGVAISRLVTGLDSLSNVLLIAGVVVAGTAYLLGDGRGAVAIRRSLGRILGGARRAAGTASVAATDKVSGQGATAVPVVRDNLGAWQAGGFVVALVLLLTMSLGWGGLLVLGVALTIYELALPLLAGNGDTASTTEPSST
jgi:hypothetical protein